MQSYGLAIIGNGFDLYYNQPTRYDDFYNVIKDMREMSIEDFQQKYSTFEGVANFYNSTKSILITNFFFQYFLSYNQTYDCWNAFESELLLILEMFDEMLNEIESQEYAYGYDEQKKIYCVIRNSKNFNKLISIVSKCKFYEYVKECYDGNFYDIVYFDLKTTKNNEFHVKDRIKKYINDLPKQLYDDLIEFCEVFSMYINIFVSIPCSKKLNDQVMVHNIINYNYTNLAEKLFGADKCCYIHGSLKTHNNIVFGVDSSNEKISRFSYFYKRVQRVSRKTDYNKIGSALWNKQNIVVIGHSLDFADDDSLKYIFKPSPEFEYKLITIYYYKGDRFAMANLGNNLSRILGDEIYDEMLYEGKIEFKPLEE